MKSENNHGQDPVTTAATHSFQPSRGRAWGLMVVGVSFWLLTLGLGSLPFVVVPERPTPASVDWILLALCLWVGGLGSWLVALGFQLGQMYVRADAAGIDLRVRRYEWFLTNPFGICRVRLPWADVRGVRLWAFANHLAPGGVQRNYVLYTTAGPLVLSNLDWPQVDELAEAIAQRANTPIATRIAELPLELQTVAQPPSGERIRLRFVRALGWLALFAGWAVLGICALLLFTGTGLQGSLLGLLAAATVLLGGGTVLRRFRLE